MNKKQAEAALELLKSELKEPWKCEMFQTTYFDSWCVFATFGIFHIAVLNSGGFKYKFTVSSTVLKEKTTCGDSLKTLILSSMSRMRDAKNELEKEIENFKPIIP